MSWRSPSLGGRVALALGFAAAGVVGLDLLVRRHDLTAAPVAPRPAAEPVRFARLPLRAVGGPILLASRASAIAPGVAPVVQILQDGSTALRRPVPLALVPGGDPDQAVRSAAIVLPGRSLAQLDARARSALVEVIGQLVNERPVPVGRFRTVDFGLPAAELERLLGWVP